MAPFTQSSPPEGSASNLGSVAAQLAAIAARLDSLLSLKNDVAELKILMYGTHFWCNNQSGDYECHPFLDDDFKDDKEPKGEPQSPETDLVKEDCPVTDLIKENCPVTDLIKEDCICDIPMSEVIRVMESCDLEVSDEKHAGDNQRIKDEYEVLCKDKLERFRYNDQNVNSSRLSMPIKFTDLSIKVKEQATTYEIMVLLPGNEIVDANLKRREIDLQSQFILVHQWVYEAGQPTIEWHIAWHNNSLLSDLRTSRFFGRAVLIQF